MGHYRAVFIYGKKHFVSWVCILLAVLERPPHSTAPGEATAQPPPWEQVAMPLRPWRLSARPPGVSVTRSQPRSENIK